MYGEFSRYQLQVHEMSITIINTFLKGRTDVLYIEIFFFNFLSVCDSTLEDFIILNNFCQRKRHCLTGYQSFLFITFFSQEYAASFTCKKANILRTLSILK